MTDYDRMKADPATARLLEHEERKLAVTERLAEMGFHVPDDEELDRLLDALATPVLAAERQTDKATWLLRQLANRLDFIHEDPAYLSVWSIHQIHVGPYKGPTYEAELEAARAFLNGGVGEGDNDQP